MQGCRGDNHMRMYLINYAVYFCLIEGNGWIILQQSCQESLDLARFNPAGIVEVINAECDCGR